MNGARSPCARAFLDCDIINSHDSDFNSRPGNETSMICKPNKLNVLSCEERV